MAAGKQLEFELRIAGPLSPLDVSIDEVADLLDATAKAIGAVAEAENLKPPKVTLSDIRQGSAVYVLQSEDPVWLELVPKLYDAVKVRGRGASPTVRRALGRVVKAARSGPIELRLRNWKGRQRKAPVLISMPVEEDAHEFSFGTEHFGRVVGVSATGDDRNTVRLELRDGGRLDFVVSETLAVAAGRLFKKSVRAFAQGMSDVRREYDLELTALEEMPEIEEDFLDAMSAIRQQLTDQGVEIDIDAWLADLD